MTEDQRPTTITYSQPVHVTLTRNAKGTYQWEISVHAEDVAKALTQIDEVDVNLKGKYGANPE